METQIESFKKLPRELEKPAFAAKTTGKIEAVLEASPRDRGATTARDFRRLVIIGRGWTHIPEVQRDQFYMPVKSAYSPVKGDSICT
jgi:hypothetical protein